MATSNPETVMNGDALFANAASSSSGSDLSDEFGQLKLNDNGGSGGSAALEKSENPWARGGEDKECHTQNGTDSIPAGNAFTSYNSRQLDITNGLVGIGKHAPPYRTPWSTESSPSYHPSRPAVSAQSLMTQTMPWIEAHEAWVNATKRSRANAMATSQFATAALQRRRVNSLPVDSTTSPYSFYQKSSRRVVSPNLDPFDSLYHGDPTNDYFGIGPVSDSQNDVFLPIPASQRASRAAQLYGKGPPSFTVVCVHRLPLWDIFFLSCVKVPANMYVA